MQIDGFDIEAIAQTFFIIRNTLACNIGVAVSGDRALIIDSGNLPSVSAGIIRYVEQRLSKHVDLLFNTHYHSDHTFGNQCFTCPILASRVCRDTMQACLSTHWNENEIEQAKKENPKLVEEWKDLRITFPTQTFEDELEYDFHGLNIAFRKLGGHSPDSSIAYFPDYRLAFAGDLVFAGLYPTLLLHDGNPLELIAASRTLIGMELDIIIPGHGVTCDIRTVKKLIDYWTCLVLTSREAIVLGLKDDEAIRYVRDRCIMPDVPPNERKQNGNAAAVLRFLGTKEAGSASGG